MAGLPGDGVVKGSLNRMKILHTRTQPFRVAIFFIFEVDYLSFYTHLESTGRKGCDKIYGVAMSESCLVFHGLFSRQWKNHSLKKTD